MLLFVAGGAVLEVTGLTKHFAGITAIGNVEFRLEPGTIVGLVGPNGAGKTTLFGLISAVLKPTRGQLTFNGVALNGQPFQYGHLCARSLAVETCLPF
jgi:ABC-type branched-subunit amino acid transport system ATPase component